MRQIKQNVEATFVAPTLKDAITVLPIMDGLCGYIHELKENPNSDANICFGNMCMRPSIETAQAMLRVFTECGFVSSGYENA